MSFTTMLDRIVRREPVPMLVPPPDPFEEEPTSEWVKRGAALLDRVDPDWFVDIDAATLNISSQDRCIVAQWTTTRLGYRGLRGTPYSVGMRMLEDVTGQDIVPITHGFAGCGMESIWREEIAKRRLARR